MKAIFLLWLCSLSGRVVLAQMDSSPDQPANVVRRTHPEYDEEIMYYGKHNKYFSVRIFQKNGVLFRLDSYMLLPKVLPNGFQLDSLGRIVHHGPTKIMYSSGQVYLSCDYKDGLVNGPFQLFYENGAIKRREYYKAGRVKQSQCYTPTGEEQPCKPFYQTAQFAGDEKLLTNYLKRKLDSLVDGERIWTIRATLTINEIGQVINVRTAVMTDVATKPKIPVVNSYVRGIIQNMPEWTADNLNWKPALSDGVATSSTCNVSVFRVNGSLRCELSYGL